MASNRVNKFAYFSGKSIEFVIECLERNNLSKSKAVFEGKCNCFLFGFLLLFLFFVILCC